MTTIEFTVDGEPAPKQSFRYVSGKHSYQTPRVRAWQENVAWAAKQAYKGELLCGPLAVTIVFHVKHKRRVDVDNLGKGSIDALRGVLFADDRQIVDLRLIKIQPTNENMTRVVVTCGEDVMASISDFR